MADVQISLTIGKDEPIGIRQGWSCSVRRLHKECPSPEAALQTSEQNYRLFFQDNPVPMWVFDRGSLRFLAVNKAAVCQYGYSESEFLNLCIDQIRPEEDVSRLLDDVNQRYTGLQQPSQWRHRKKDGTIIDVEIVAHEVAFHGFDGELVAAYDITDRLRSQQLLRDSEAKYRVLFEDSSEAHWLLSSDGYLDSNGAALKMFGLSRKSEFTHPADCSPMYQPDGMSSRLAADARLRSALMGSSATFDWIHQRKNGELFPAEVRLSALQLSGRQLLLATVRDVTERRRGERAVALQAAILKAQSETTLDGILAVDENNRVIFANPQFAAHFGIPPEVIDSRDDVSIRNFVAQAVEEPETFLQTIEGLYSQRERRSIDEIRLANGKTFERYSAPLNESGGFHRGRIWYFHEITDRRAMETALREAEERYRTIFENAGIGIFRATPDGSLVTANRALAQIHGFSSAEDLFDSVSNAGTQLFVNPGDIKALVAAAAKRDIVEGTEIEVFSEAQTRRWIRVNCHAIRNARGELEYLDGTAEDITERKLAESRVETLAYYDALTGLANRSLLHDRIAHALAGARRSRRKIAVLFIDLDRFKFINDSLGHTVGDLLLKEVASRLTRLIRAEDTVARIGGDEFVIVMGDIESPRDAEVVATRILEQISSTALIDGHSLHVSCSIGISLYPENGPDRETLIRYADQAMYAAKESGRDAYRFFSAELNDQIQIEASIEQDLRKALRDGEFSLNYQPQMAIRTGRLAGMEALLRWQHSSKGMIPPNVFIEIAENTGLILPIGNWALRTACEQARKWHELGILNVPVAVNISAVQFRQKGFCDLIATTLKETRLPPQLLELELTESLLLLNRDSISSILQQLRDMGVGLAIDDFGTGYSSLSYLRQFRVQKLKIDRSFIKDLTTDADDAAITAAIIDLGRNLNLRIIAEGVENEGQVRFLREHRCDEIQGFIFSRPLIASDMELFLRNEHKRSNAMDEIDRILLSTAIPIFADAISATGQDG